MLATKLGLFVACASGMVAAQTAAAMWVWHRKGMHNKEIWKEQGTTILKQDAILVVPALSALELYRWGARSL